MEVLSVSITLIFPADTKVVLFNRMKFHLSLFGLVISLNRMKKSIKTSSIDQLNPMWFTKKNCYAISQTS